MIRKPGYSIEHDSWFIPLTKGVIALVDAEMVPILSQNNWYAAKHDRRWVAISKGILAGGKRASYMHRIVVNAAANTLVDHVNHRLLNDTVIDNRKSNLRICTAAQNMQNIRPRIGATSKFKGVHWHKTSKKWRSTIRTEGSSRHLGSFRDEVEAAQAYDEAAIKRFGDFALTNKQLGLLP